MRRVRSQFLQSILVGGLLAVVLGAALPAGAIADPFAKLGSFGNTPNGSQGGQLSFSRGVAVNRSGNGAPAGSVYVVEANPNHRISQFTASGGFIRTWGYDVVDGVNFPGAPNNNGTGFEVCDVTAGNTANQCKAGLTGAAAGQMANPAGIAVDQTNGYLYVTGGNRRVDVFSGAGQFAGAFGWGVDTGAAAPEICTTASTCQIAGAAGADAGRFSALTSSAPAIDPSVPGRVLVPDQGNLRVSEYATTVTGGTLTTASFVKAFGWGVDTGAAALETCTTVSTCQIGTSGNGPGQFATGAPTAAAVDSTGAIYAVSAPACSTGTPCRIQKFAPDASSATDFGPASGAGQLTFTAGLAIDVAALSVAVNPSNDHVFVLRKDSQPNYRVLEYDSTGTYLETHPVGDALPALAQTGAGLAIGVAGRVYSNMGAAAGGQVFILGPVDPPIPTVGPVSPLGSTTATFNGTVEIPAPGSPTFTTKYHFEYSEDGVNWTSVPTQDQNIPNGTTGTHPVSQNVTGLAPGTLYSVRLVATTGPTATSMTATFTTDRAFPRVALSYADEVNQTGARLGAHIDPEGLNTTYHFEWGATPAPYANSVPAFERQVGSGSKLVIANEPIDGLEPQSTYHYRVVARSFCHPIDSDDTVPSNVPCVTEGPDQTFETLNSCGLTDGRCYEMVSPRDKGVLGAAGDVVSLGQELQFQVAPDDPAIEYTIAYGLPDATAGEELVYRADRDASGWSSAQLSAPAVVAGDHASGTNAPSKALGFSRDLSCGVIASVQPLGDSPPTATLEAGRSALYRRDAGGNWTTITDLAPTNTVSITPRGEYGLIGASEAAPFSECERVVFVSQLQYPGVSGVGDLRLYEWVNGVLGNVGVIPGPDGPGCSGGACVAEASPGAANTVNGPPNYWNAVSDDASRVFFTAVSKLGGDIGKQAVFLRKDGAVGVDVSQSQTVSPPLSNGAANNDDSVYQTASADGSKVFFTARYGLASNADGSAVHSSTGPSSCASDGAGCDLYQYSVESGKLTDLSADTDLADPADASVAGVLGASDDGDYVYFAARGQLVSGKGSSQAENLADDTYSVYLAHGGAIGFVGKITEQDASNQALVGSSSEARWTSRVTSSGEHLVFESRANPTEYDSGGKYEAYIYDAGGESLSCVSCRRDGLPSVVPDGSQPSNDTPLISGRDVENKNSPPRTISDDGRRVFFSSYDRLAVGATEGRPNLYQWENGQISFIGKSAPSVKVELRFAGASRTGSDIYFSTVDRLTWEDSDGKLDIYDARVGGGFAAPPVAPDPCDPLAEGACSGGGALEGGTPVETDRAGSGNSPMQPRAVFSVARLSKSQLRALRAGRGVDLAVRVSRPGRVSVRGSAVIGGLRATVISASHEATAAGRIAIPVALSRAARKRIARNGALKVTLRVGFAGSPRSAVSKLTFKTAKAKKNDGRSRARRATSDRRAGK